MTRLYRKRPDVSSILLPNHAYKAPGDCTCGLSALLAAQSAAHPPQIERLEQQNAALKHAIDDLVAAHRPQEESLRVQHARKQGAADGFQQGWHAALHRVREGDKVHDLSELVPQPPDESAAHRAEVERVTPEEERRLPQNAERLLHAAPIFPCKQIKQAHSSEHAEAEVERLTKARDAQWQPIETAPKDEGWNNGAVDGRREYGALVSHGVLGETHRSVVSRYGRRSSVSSDSLGMAP